jgi:L-serine dehydratase, iron-sulfur-dependent, beta subunit
MNIFDMIGPIMVGPSSSHTAGAARAGYVARMLLGEEPVKAVVTLSGSFAQTYQGHGTDRAIIGGILGFSPSDLRIRNSFEEAKRNRLSYTFQMEELENTAPNTAKIELQGANGAAISTIISSVGGGVVQVVRINDADVKFSAEYPTTVVFNDDKPGFEIPEIIGVCR